MFKLIAIRPLKGCIPSICKCLQIDTFYYLCNDYRIVEEGVSLRDEYVKTLPDDFFSLNTTNNLQINISAIVGKNGDGKSTLIELIMRLINNCAKHYNLTDSDRLLRVEGVKAELYYQLDSVIYCIKETEDDQYTSLLQYADVSDSTLKLWKKQMSPVKSVKSMNDLFYTIISNYSHYAYNTNDFKKEWSVGKNSGDNKRCWLYYLFHKNDGYRTPMTIHPYRVDGNIDVNREKELTMQRLIALYIQEPDPNDDPNSFRNIDNNSAQLLQLTEIGFSKLQEYTIVQYFKDNKTISLLSNYIAKIEALINKYNDFDDENFQDNIVDIIESRIDFYIGVGDYEYNDFLNCFYTWMKGNRNVYSSKSDLRKLLISMKKYKNIINEKFQYNGFDGKYKKYDKLNLIQLIRIRFVYDVMKMWGFETHILFKDYLELSIIEKCQHYIVYKTINICTIYPEYRNIINNGDNSFMFNISMYSKIQEQIINDKTHVTLKLRQCFNFINQLENDKINIFEKLSDKDLRSELGRDFDSSLIVSFNKLKGYYKKASFPLEFLPPPIYKTRILYKSKVNNHSYIPYEYLSSGEKQLLNNIGALIYHLRNIDSVTDMGRKYMNVNIILEEIELYFHPEYQRKIVKILIEKLNSLILNNIKRVNITFVTHSPFILSDIPLCNVLFIRDGKVSTKMMQENTFGANIHGLLKNGFFLPSLPMGEFAYEKINYLFYKLNRFELNNNDKTQKEWFYSNIMRVGEPYLREELMKLYMMHYPNRYDD